MPLERKLVEHGRSINLKSIIKSHKHGHTYTQVAKNGSSKLACQEFKVMINFILYV